jgi:phage baseplate assembly protein W
VSTEILYPFQLDASGSVATTTNPYAQANQHVTSLVSTTPGERVMQPGYGVSLAALVFAPDNPALVQTIQRDVTNALAVYEPTVQVNSVSPVPGNDPTLGQAMVNVDFQVGALPGQPGAAAQTATVLVGGAVITA